jgi:alkylation response protein AidB-like acyl-CoA dehydrogenase
VTDGQPVSPPSPGLVGEEFRQAARAYLASILTARTATSVVTVLGAGQDNLETGRQFLARLGGEGWSVPTWPRELGGAGLGPDLASVWNEELARFEVPDLYPFRIGLNMVGPTLLKHATPEQQRRWLPGIATGKEIWCQLFSEPGAGSDLAGLATRARRHQDGWELTGQKVWSSRAQYARWGLLLARSDPDAEKHAGITCFVLPMDARGVEVRPLRQMNGDAHFNEVFLDRVVISDSQRLGEPGEGWAVARTTLAHERTAAGNSDAITPEQLIELARRQGRAQDPVIRQRLAEFIIQFEVARLTAERMRSSAGAAGPHGSASKLRMVRVQKAAADLAADLLGVALTTTPGQWQTLVLTAPSLSIRGGTDEVQRGILAERVLNLPREPDPFRGRPWSQIPRSQRPAGPQGAHVPPLP